MARRLTGVLLDNMLDVDLTDLLGVALGPDTYLVEHVRDHGWQQIQNGPLLEAMAEAGFTVLLTSDVRLGPQRAPALARLSIGVVTLRLGQGDVATLRPHLARIAEAVRRVRPGQVLTVERADA